ncbi:uncharacterized protein LOC131625603 [Vicia villosa]|uniref:uncharacterized protein LOC131625603 n=1 Tax=Vicia villosa TaxID=3911 RepID=UPI00273AA1DF|nr:uncharacterized protein LOC131625603 [Vicia villosa]
MGKVYKVVQDCELKVEWRNLLYKNIARPRACFILWLACHEKLATKDRLHRFGMIDNVSCCFCSGMESLNHLFFECTSTREIWLEVLEWIQICHIPGEWHNERHWIIQHTRGKSAKAAVLKMAITETIYEIWNMRNNKSFGKNVGNTKIGQKIIDTLIYRGWNNKKVRKYIAILMMGGL